MYRKVDNWFNIAELEKGILNFWNKNKIFEKLREKNKHGKSWSFIDGPITANNKMGVHHSWGRALKDAYQRYWSMNGRKLRFQNGFDCQGLWVEVEVEKELGFRTKKDIEDYGIDKFINKCKERVIRYSDIITKQSVRLGYWMDWDNSYYTMSNENNYTIWSFLKKCHDRGLIYKGHDVMPWCPRCGTGLSQHEMHEGYKEVKHTSLYLRFPVKNRDNRKEAFLVWTTTPWTLTSNIALAVNPNLIYVKAKQDEWTYYIVKDRLEPVLKNKGAWEIIDEISGRDLLDLHLNYKGPYDELDVQQSVRDAAGYHSIIPWHDISAQEGTGIVHIAPGCGAEDFELGKEFVLPVIDPIDESGYFKEGFDRITGMNAGSINDDIINDMQNKGMLYFTEEYEHKYPHCWRCDSELLFRLVDEWFIEIDSWRDEIKENAKRIKWYPSFGLDLELDWLSNMRDWMISKKRYWGLALPVWECSRCNSFTVIGGLEELKEKAVYGIEGVLTHGPHKPWIDEVKIICPECGEKISRIPDVGNPWLDAGIVPYSTVAYNEDKALWQEWVPADLILECFPGQFRNWFYSLLAMSTIMENIPPAKNIVGHALVKDANGEEMHKSKGNAIWFDDAVEEIGADVLRWQFFIHDISNEVNFGYESAKLLRGKFFNTLWNCYAFYANYARLIDFYPYERKFKKEHRNKFDQWILTKLNNLIKICRESVESYDLKTACRNIDDFVDDLSNWYIRHNRRRFWRTEITDDTLAAYETLFECVYTVIRLLAPVLPMLTEEIYLNLVRTNLKDAPESIHLTDYPVADQSMTDIEIIDEMDVIRNIIALAISIRNRAKIKVRQPLSSLAIALADEKELKIIRKYSDIISEDLNVKDVRIKDNADERPTEKRIKPNYKTLGPKYGDKTQVVADAITEKFGNNEMNADDPEIIVNGSVVIIDKDDLVTEYSEPQGLSIIDYKSGWIALDKNITEELETEGLAREFVRHVQVLRKKIGLEPEDRIKIIMNTASKKINNAVKQHSDFICEELLCNELTGKKDIKDGHEIVINNEKITVSISKISNIIIH